MKQVTRSFLFIGVVFLLLITAACKKASEGIIPKVNTVEVTFITPVSATCSGKIIANSTPEITDIGVCWGISQVPSVSDSKTSGKDLTDTYAFTHSITGLSPNTTYFARAYVTNQSGTAYGNVLSFKTPVDHSGEKGTLTDIEGNVYKTSGIGSQVWTTENLRTTTFNDGSPIPPGKCYRCWSFLASPGYCWYNSDEFQNKASFGAIYNWYTVNSGKLCPSGWHVPAEKEWTILESYPGNKDIVASLNILPGGYRGDLAEFSGLGEKGIFWTSDQSAPDKAVYKSVSFADHVISGGTFSIDWGASVRCIKNETAN